MAEKAKMMLPKENSAALNPVSLMGDEKGIYFTFMSDMEKISEVLPAPLEPAFPMVSGYIVYIDKPAFTERYREAMLGVYAKYNGQIGMFPVCFVLSGPGAEMATLPGRERFGLPKKMCEREDCIRLERNGDVIRGVAERKGVTLLDVSIKLGKYNNPGAGAVYAGNAAGQKAGGGSFYCASVLEPDGSGFDKFSHVNLYSNVAEYTYRVWEPGEVTVRLQSSKDDAWGHFPVFENMGGAYSENDLLMKDLFLLDRLPAEDTMYKLLTTRYDRLSLVQEG